MDQVEELKCLTGLRGVASVFVVVFHYWPIFVTPTTALTTLLAHGYLAVDLFFVLSGFVMALNYAHLFHEGWSVKAFRTFLGRRIARVYPLYLLTTVVAFVLIMDGRLNFLVMNGWLNSKPGQSLKLALVVNLAMIQSWGLEGSLDGPGWSISAEWAAYLLFPAILWAAYKSTATIAKIVTGLSVLVLFSLSVLHSSTSAPRPFPMLAYVDSAYALPVFRCLSEFTLGIIAARLFMYHKSQLRKRHLTDFCTIILLMLACVLRTDFVIVLLFPIWILGLASGSSYAGRILASPVCHHLGILSYSIYLLHDLLAGVLVWTHGYANSRGLSHGQTYGGLLCLIITYLISLLAYRFIEKPAREGVRSLFEGPR